MFNNPEFSCSARDAVRWLIVVYSSRVQRHGGHERGKEGTVVEEVLHAVSQHLVRNLSSQSDIQGLEGMTQAIR